MKGILLAGGAGTRLHPLTLSMSKQLIPVYDKPMIYYPLSVLMLAGMRDVLIISTPEDIGRCEQLLGDGSALGCHFEYTIQPKPDGLAQAFILGEDFIGDDPCALILGDNLFYGAGFVNLLRSHTNPQGAQIFATRVKDPSRYGVVEFDTEGQVLSLEEKPAEPRSPYAVPGLYFYDNQVVELARRVHRSARGEYEITDLNRLYAAQGQLHCAAFPRGVAWLDTGTVASLHDAATFVRVVEERQGLKIGCIEEVAYRCRFIDRAQLLFLARRLGKSGYGAYLENVAASPTPSPLHRAA